MSDSGQSESGETDFQVTMYAYDGTVHLEKPDLIRYCLVGDLDSTAQEDPAQGTRHENSVVCGQHWYEKAKDLAAVKFSTTASESEEGAKEFLQILTMIEGYREDWAPVDQEGSESVDEVEEASWDQEKFTKLLTNRASWIIAICNDGGVWCKAPAEEKLKPLVSAIETSGLVPVDHSESSTGSSI